MKPSVSVFVTQPLEWQGQAYVPGQAIQVTPLDAVLLAKKRQVTLSKRKAKPLPPPEPVPVQEPEPPKRRYRRKDIQPEETAVLEPTEPQE